ncbi:MAG: SWIM zinc finger family protein, partial [Mycobacterium sp.]|nr:SWIM zinc finger family protein [Mycobacterium sp.]
MQSLIFPSIDIDSAVSLVGVDTYRRGVTYARQGRVVRCLWNPDHRSLVGNVRGSRGRTYTTTVQLSPNANDGWTVEFGVCSCPMGADCKHVAAM